ncbi:DUF6049 family protein [Janibacter sp. DB-40]|uniref:DUF6049 family protein n=1 Tax=Janibacter sp. DB-40 TaxID=3028808 RepID=UPI0032172097
MAAARRRRLRLTSIATLLAMLVLLPSAAATPLSPGEDSTESELTISSITPVVDGASTGRVDGELTNTTDETLVAPEVSLVGRAASADRDDIATWAEEAIRSPRIPGPRPPSRISSRASPLPSRSR